MVHNGFGVSLYPGADGERGSFVTSFTLELARVPIAVQALHESTKKYCADYLADKEPVDHVHVTQDDIEFERVRSAQQDEHNGVPIRRFSDAYLETLALYRKIADAMIEHDAIVFHGCVLAVDGRAYLFTAPSGTGKTTHARFWLNVVPGAYVLNGDKPLLRLMEDGVLACGTPWQGKERMGCNEVLPLAGLCVLTRDTYDHIERVTLPSTLGRLVQQTYRPDRPEALVRGVELAGAVGERVPLYRMGCTLNEQSASMSYKAMASVV